MIKILFVHDLEVRDHSKFMEAIYKRYPFFLTAKDIDGGPLYKIYAKRLNITGIYSKDEEINAIYFDRGTIKPNQVLRYISNNPKATIHWVSFNDIIKNKGVVKNTVFVNNNLSLKEKNGDQ